MTTKPNEEELALPVPKHGMQTLTKLYVDKKGVNRVQGKPKEIKESARKNIINIKGCLQKTRTTNKNKKT